MGVTVSKDISGRITVAFPYDPQLVENVKTIEGRTGILKKNTGAFRIQTER